MTLPALKSDSNLAIQYRAFIENLIASEFTGDIDTSYSARVAQATDNSVYYKLPQAVIYPRSNQDCQLIGLLATKYPEVSFAPRGGGTGTNGQSLTDGIVVDIRRYLNKVIELDVKEGWVRVQTGIVKDSLNDVLRPHGLFFSPDFSTSNRATLSGMISTDASGQGSLVYGKTSDHVIGLKAVLINGEVIETEKIPTEIAKRKADENTAEGAIYKQAIDTCINFKNTVLTRDADFSHEVKVVMDGCLSCKSCTHQCPVNIDVPHFKSIFLSVYYQRYMRPLKDLLVANVETLAPLSAKVPRLYNTLLQHKWVTWLLKKKVGYVDTPLLSYPTLVDRVKSIADKGDIEQLERLDKSEREKYVAVVQDPFTSFYDAKSVESLIKVISKMGLKPLLVPFTPNGKPVHVKGFLGKFEKQALGTAKRLNKIHELGITMVGADASLVLCYRDEYQKFLKDKRGEFFVHTIDKWLVDALPKSLNADVASNTDCKQNFFLLAHCSEKTAMPDITARWQRIFQHLSVNLTHKPVGCCGMAGTYGHEVSHLESSKALYTLSWAPVFARAQKETLNEVLVNGFSCRSQVARFEGRKPRHPIEVVNELI